MAFSESTTIGFACLFIGLFLGVPVLTLGLTTTILGRGLSIIVGPPMIIIGIVLSLFVIGAVRILNLSIKYVVAVAIVIALPILILEVDSANLEKLKTEVLRIQSEQRDEQWIKEKNARDYEILKAVEKNR